MLWKAVEQTVKLQVIWDAVTLLWMNVMNQTMMLGEIRGLLAHHFMVIPKQIQSILYRYVWTHIFMYPAYEQWRTPPIKTSLTFDDKTPVASDQMQRPDVYLQVQGLVLWTCHRYVFHISLSVLTVNEVHTPLQTEWVQVYIDITSILNVLYGIPRYLLVP